MRQVVSLYLPVWHPFLFDAYILIGELFHLLLRNACWNNNDPALKAAIAKVMNRFEAAKKIAKSMDVAASSISTLQHAQVGQ